MIQNPLKLIMRILFSCSCYLLPIVNSIYNNTQKICHKPHLLCLCFSLDETGLTDVGATHLANVLKAECCRIKELR